MKINLHAKMQNDNVFLYILNIRQEIVIQMRPFHHPKYIPDKQVYPHCLHN